MCCRVSVAAMRRSVRVSTTARNEWQTDKVFTNAFVYRVDAADPLGDKTIRLGSDWTEAGTAIVVLSPVTKQRIRTRRESIVKTPELSPKLGDISCPISARVADRCRIVVDDEE